MHVWMGLGACRKAQMGRESPFWNEPGERRLSWEMRWLNKLRDSRPLTYGRFD